MKSLFSVSLLSVLVFGSACKMESDKKNSSSKDSQENTTVTTGNFVDSCEDENTSPAFKNTMNAIKDTVGEEDCSLLWEELKTTTRLQMWGDELEDLTPIGMITSLKELSLWENNITDIRPLSKLTSLRKLVLDSNRIRDVRPLGNLPELVSLDLSHNQVEDVQALGDISSLKYLYLTGNEIEDASPIANLDGLVRLHLYSNPIIEDRRSCPVGRQVPAPLNDYCSNLVD